MLDELEHMLLVAEHGTFTRAAKHAHLSQPALSVSIQRLEEFFGAQLFHRGRRGAELTAAGRALLPKARAALAAVSDGRRAVAEVLDLRSGEVRIGAGATASTYLLPPVLAAFRRKYPDVRIQLRELTRERVAALVHAGELDIGVVSGPGEPWKRDEFILVGARGAKVEGSSFVTFPPGTTTRGVLDRHFPGAPIIMELSSMGAAKGHVREGVGIALISRAAVKRDLAQRRLRELRHPLTPIPRELNLVHRGVDRLTPAAAALRELLMKRADDELARAAPAG